MSGLALAGRYAKALFELATKNKSNAQVATDLQQLAGAVAALPQLKAALLNPVISKNTIGQILAQILEKLKANKLTINFVSVLVQNGRIKNLVEIAAAYESLMMQTRGEENAYITTAAKLDTVQISEIEKALSSALGNKIKAIVAVNEEILGGIIVRIGSKMLDSSLSGKLNKLAVQGRQAMAGLD